MQRIKKTGIEKWNIAQSNDFRWYAERMYKPRINEWLPVLDFFKPYLDQAGKVIVEIGCGPTGGMLKFMKAKMRIGVDPLSNQFYIKGFDKINETDILFLNSCGEDVPLVNEFAHVVACIHSLSHVRNPFPVLEEAERILKTGGELWVMDLLRNSAQCTGDHPFPFEEKDLMEWINDHYFETILMDKIQAADDDEERLPIIYGIFKKKSPNIKLSSMIAFSKGPFEEQICGGWYPIEDGEKPFRWVSNKFSAYLFRERTQHKMNLEGYINIDHFPEKLLRFSLSVNDILLGHYTFTKSQYFSIYFNVPDEIPSGKVKVKGISSSFFNPSKISDQGDNRDLAFTIHRIGFC